MITLPNETLTLTKYKKYFVLFCLYINLNIECEIIAI